LNGQFAGFADGTFQAALVAASAFAVRPAGSAAARMALIRGNPPVSENSIDKHHGFYDYL